MKFKVVNIRGVCYIAWMNLSTGLTYFNSSFHSKQPPCRESLLDGIESL